MIPHRQLWLICMTSQISLWKVHDSCHLTGNPQNMKLCLQAYSSINHLVLSVWNLPKQTTRKAAIILQLSSGYSGQRRAETAVTNEAMLQHKTCMNVGGRVWSINHGTEETPLLSSPDTSLGITWAKEAKEGNMVSQPTEGFLPVPLGRR